MGLRVPTEIFGIIIDLLHNDKLALSACSLVTRAWFPRIRDMLFRSITIHAKSDRSNFTLFLDFLRSSPELANLIQELTLDGLCTVTTTMRRPNRKESRTIHETLSYSTLLDILDALPVLSSLGLQYVSLYGPLDWEADEHDDMARRFEIGTARELALRKLTLVGVGVPMKDDYHYGLMTASEVRRILGVFSSVQQLRVFNLSISRYPDIRLNPRVPLYSQTQPLSLVTRNNDDLDKLWDTINRIPVPVRSLSLTGKDFKRVRELRGFGTKLKDLSLDFTSVCGCEYFQPISWPS